MKCQIYLSISEAPPNFCVRAANTKISAKFRLSEDNALLSHAESWLSRPMSFISRREHREHRERGAAPALAATPNVLVSHADAAELRRKPAPMSFFSHAKSAESAALSPRWPSGGYTRQSRQAASLLRCSLFCEFCGLCVRQVNTRRRRQRQVLVTTNAVFYLTQTPQSYAENQVR